MITKDVNVGIIGFGYMGHFHLKRIRELDGITVTAIYDSSKERQDEVEQENLVFCEKLEDLLSIEELSLIIICTPNNVHKEYAIKALSAGKHVLCEKPATMNVEEAKLIVKCAKENKRFFTVHQNRRWDSDYLVVKKVLNENLIGTFTTINTFTYGQRGVCYGWRADPIAGGGMLYDWGVHLIDQILQLYQGVKVRKIYGRLVSVLTPDVDDFFEVKLILENNTCANISVGTFALQPQPRWFLFGDRGTLKLDDFSGKIGGIARIRGEVKGFHNKDTSKALGPSRTMAHLEPEHLETLDIPIVEDHTYDFYKNLIAAVKGEEKPYITHDEIIRVMQIIDYVFESSRIGQVIEVNL